MKLASPLPLPLLTLPPQQLGNRIKRRQASVHHSAVPLPDLNDLSRFIWPEFEMPRSFTSLGDSGHVAIGIQKGFADSILSPIAGAPLIALPRT